MKNAEKYGTALVLGLGISGESAAELLLKEGTRVTAVDSGSGRELREKTDRLRRKGAEAILNASALPQYDFDVCIVSPGIRADSDWVRRVEDRGIEVISELELGWSRCSCNMLAITGSNGKSTMTKLCYDCMKSAGRNTAVAGNYGFPLCGLAGGARELDWAVVEVSSFQLERVKDFQPDVAVLLNVQPDHLDRHGSMAEYFDTKMRLFANMRDNHTGLVLDQDYEEARHRAHGLNKWRTFGSSEDCDYRYVDGTIRCRADDAHQCVSIKNTVFENPVMGLTAAAAVGAMSTCGIAQTAVIDAISVFEPLPHRMQKVREIGGVAFIDDSKATNLAALAGALSMLDGNIRLVAGGILKEKDLEFVKELLARKVGRVYLIGRSGSVMAERWKDAVDCCLCRDIGEAVGTAWRDSKPGDTVLLSPGCASFDQFKNFEDRGNTFSDIVGSLNEEK